MGANKGTRNQPSVAPEKVKLRGEQAREGVSRVGAGMPRAEGSWGGERAARNSGWKRNWGDVSIHFIFKR